MMSEGRFEVKILQCTIRMLLSKSVGGGGGELVYSNINETN